MHTFILSHCPKSFQGFKSFINFQIWWVYFLHLRLTTEIYRYKQCVFMRKYWRDRLFFIPIIDFRNTISIYVSMWQISFAHFTNTDDLNDDFVEHRVNNLCFECFLFCFVLWWICSNSSFFLRCISHNFHTRGRFSGKCTDAKCFLRNLSFL